MPIKNKMSFQSYLRHISLIVLTLIDSNSLLQNVEASKMQFGSLSLDKIVIEETAYLLLNQFQKLKNAFLAKNQNILILFKGTLLIFSCINAENLTSGHICWPLLSEESPSIIGTTKDIYEQALKYLISNNCQIFSFT